MGALYRCGSCGRANLEHRWNEATRAFYVEDIREIGKDGWRDCLFVCPNCGVEVDGYLIEEVDEPSVEQSKGIREIPVKIKRLHPDAVIPQYATELAAGFDLVAVEDVVIAPGETKLVPIGFAVEIPEGFEMQIRPRSGVTLKTMLRVGNAPGTIDADFRGEVKVIVDNVALAKLQVGSDGRMGPSFEYVTVFHDVEGSRKRADGLTPDGTYLIRKGDRIAQGVIAPVYRADFIEVDELGETERGGGGFGSTGVKTEVDE